MNWLIPYAETTGYRRLVTPGKEMQQIGLGLINLAPGGQVELATDEAEAVLVILAGTCTVEVDGVTYAGLGARRDPFSGRATSVYVPRESQYRVTNTGNYGMEIAVVTARAERKFPAFVVRPEEVAVNHRGALNYQREVHDIVVDNAEGRVDRIVVGETFSFPGHWSSYPPHKHDTYNPPFESEMEEIYHFRIKPSNGFAAQFVYTGDNRVRQAYMIGNGDSVILPYGYHPVAAAPGYQVYYLWVMAGERGRKLTPCDDPNHAWISNVAPMLRGK